MRRLAHAGMLALAILGSPFLAGCRTTSPADGGELPTDGSGTRVTAWTRATGLGDVRLDGALITTHRRMLGLALHHGESGPEVHDLAPGHWFIGVTFRLDGPGPEFRGTLVNAEATDRRDACRVRVLRMDGGGRVFVMEATGGQLTVDRWMENDGLVTRMDGTLVVKFSGGRRIETTFEAPVQGIYLAP